MPVYVLHPLFSQNVVRVDVPRTTPPSPPSSQSADIKEVREQPAAKPISTLPEPELAKVLEVIRAEGGTLEDAETAALI